MDGAEVRAAGIGLGQGASAEDGRGLGRLGNARARGLVCT